ncbi:MAG TPA: hypothetical protein VJ346_01495 [Bacteroidales bacterium]|nr:hypothetical protein [Bacteroidales bacterium]
MKQPFKTLVWLTIFSIAMGYLESSVVVYLRAIMYPDGFQFPLAPFDSHLAVTEIIREAATIIMLAGAGIIAGKTFSERFAWFIYCFAIWDIFYYIFLKVLLNWPESLMTWDILFLIPATWVGPVITPVIVSLTMILFAMIIIFYGSRKKVYISLPEWILFIVGTHILILAFIWDYSNFILSRYSPGEIWRMSDHKPLYELGLQYIPHSFNWLLFWIGEILIITGIFMLFIRVRKNVGVKRLKYY